MKKVLYDIHKLTLLTAKLVSKKQFKDITEEDVDTLGESVELLNDLYETLYDEVFVILDKE
jgi:hypothetical protein